jgi:hypothetical protein
VRPVCQHAHRSQGGNVGLMGAVAEAVGGALGPDQVLGVIPAALAPREVQTRSDACQMHYLPSMPVYALDLASQTWGWAAASTTRHAPALGSGWRTGGKLQQPHEG